MTSARRLPGIVGYEMPVARCEAKFKLGQDERPRFLSYYHSLLCSAPADDPLPEVWAYRHQSGLEIFAEHTADARANPGKHPNIDRLLEVIASGQGYGVKLIEA